VEHALIDVRHQVAFKQDTDIAKVDCTINVNSCNNNGV
jgi:hypothetical protein